MKVTVVIDSLSQGGAEQSTAATAAELVAKGHEFDVVLLRSDAPDREHALRAQGVQVTVLPPGVGRVATVRRIHAHLRRRRPDVCHLILFEPIVLGALAARLAGVATTATVTITTPTPASGDIDAPGSLSRVWAAERIERAVLRHVIDVVHAVSPGVADDVINVRKVPSAKVVVGERGRDGRRFHPVTARARAEARAALGVRPDAQVVVALARQEAAKGLDTLVDAVARLVPSRPDLVVLLAGRDGNESAALRQRIAEHGLADKVRLLGDRRDPEVVLAAADVYALSSRREGAAGAVIEAMATGLPIVATDVAGLRGVLDGGQAHVVPIGDAGAIASSIARLLDDPVSATRMARRGRVTFEERFTLDRASDAMAAVYRAAAPTERPSRTEAARVLLGTWRLSPVGGIPRVVRTLVAHLDPDALDLVVCSARPLWAIDDLSALGERAQLTSLDHRGPTRPRPLDRARMVVAFAREVRRRDPDVIHLQTGTAWMAALVFWRRRARPAGLLEVHDAPSGGVAGRVSLAVDRWLVRRRGFRPLVHSSTVRREVAAAWRVPISSVEVFPLGIELPDETLVRAGDGARPTVVAVASRLAASKNVPLLLEVARRVTDRVPEVRVIVVGDGPDRTDLERRRDEMGLADVVRLVGTVPDVGQVLAEADVFLSTSDVEGFGLAILEALAAGLPIVTTSVGCVPDLVDSDDHSISTAPPGDAATLASHVIDLLIDPERARQAGKHGRELVEERGSATAMARRYEQLYAELAPPRG